AEDDAAIKRRETAAGEVEAAPRGISALPAVAARTGIAGMERADEGAGRRDREPIAAVAACTARAAMGNVALDQIVVQREAAGAQVVAAPPRVPPRAAVATGPTCGVGCGCGPASSSTGPAGAAGRVVEHRHVRQRHLATVDQQTAAERGCA